MSPSPLSSWMRILWQVSEPSLPALSWVAQSHTGSPLLKPRGPTQVFELREER